MTAKPTLTLLCLVAPLLAGWDTLEVYGHLTDKTVLAPSTLSALPDAIIPDLPGAYLQPESDKNLPTLKMTGPGE
jgi:hypothetical protein